MKIKTFKHGIGNSLEINFIGKKWNLRIANSLGEKIRELTVERDAYKEAVIDIEKSLYLGDDLNDKEILDWYIEVTKTIKEHTKSLLNQFNNTENNG